MVKIEISSIAVKTKSGTSKAGRPYTLREQEGYAYTTDADGKARPHPQLVRFLLEGDDPPYAAGDYTLSPASLWVDRYDSFAISPRLVPLAKKP